MEICTDILAAASKAYDRLSPFRAARYRFKQFTFGRQWDDMITTPSGKRMTEGEQASQAGRMPLTNNMINRLVKTIVGHFRSRDDTSSPIEDSRNRLEELDSRMLEEFLVSGCAVQRVVNEKRPCGDGVWVDNVSPDRFFCNEIRDPRAFDLEIIGMLHDWSLPETIGRFSGGSRAGAEEIRRLYASMSASTGAFFNPHEAGRCRVIEVWTLEAAERLRCHDPLTASLYTASPSRESEITALNRRRAKRGQPRVQVRYEFTTAWVGRFLTPEGHVLKKLTAERHPFAVKFYPLLDGEIHPFVEGLIDQQKYINRLITLIDNMMSSSAKGVLLFPEDEISDQLDWNDVRKIWASYDGVLPYNPIPGSPGPRQIVTNPATGGAYELVNLEMQLFDRAAGVGDSLQGRISGSIGNSASLFDAQTRNAIAALADIFGAFNDFRAARNSLLG